MAARAAAQTAAQAARMSASAAPPGPLGFGSAQPLDARELRDAPVRWPRPSRLQEPLKPPSKRAAGGLERLGLGTVGELLEHLPSDSREARTISGLQAGEPATVTVEVRSIRARPVRSRRMRPLVEASVFDASGSMRATFFNQPWLVERYPPGTRVLLHGKPDARGGFGVSHHAPAAQEIGREAGEESSSGSVAHYPAADGITSTELLTLVQGARGALREVPEFLGAGTRVAEALPERAAALTAMHFPRAPREQAGGRRRLAFDELLLTQLVFLRRRAERHAREGAVALDGPRSLTARWLEHELPFAPTGDQLRAIETIDADLARTRPMQRLLMGEVGSGKTVVALYAMLRAAEHDLQAAMMAPTETLAEQHFATIQKLLGREQARIALLTGSTPAARRRDTLAKLASGELSIVVGTHALIEPDVAFATLAVAVIDEQHRFGVRQREALGAGGREAHAPPAHTLHMTATPIPRTQSLARYGDLDTSTLRELPRGRQPIATRLLVGDGQRAEAYEHLRAELRAGRQAYVVCPLIEEAEEDGAELAATAGAGRAALRAATAELARLRGGELAGFELELLHGGMRPAEKQAAMAAFSSGRAQVLVATTVIEVGVDVPNATVMLVENGERFGLSQLHQLRGRVGRGEHAATCYVVGHQGAPRLRALVQHDDGFRLAEIDLELRSEGDLIGTRQSGLGRFAVARLPEDAELLERARACAEAIVAADPMLGRSEHALLLAELERRFGGVASAPIPG